jgi:hypothetical protein
MRRVRFDGLTTKFDCNGNVRGAATARSRCRFAPSSARPLYTRFAKRCIFQPPCILPPVWSTIYLLLQKVISPRFTILNLIFKPLDPLGTATDVRTKRLSIGEAHDISSVCGKKVRDPVRALRGVWGFCMGAQGA